MPTIMPAAAQATDTMMALFAPFSSASQCFLIPRIRMQLRKGVFFPFPFLFGATASERYWRPGGSQCTDDGYETGHHGRVVVDQKKYQDAHYGQNEMETVFNCTWPIWGKSAFFGSSPFQTESFLASIMNEEQDGEDSTSSAGIKATFIMCQIAGVGELGHQKGAGPHDRRHELPPVEAAASIARPHGAGSRLFSSWEW